MTIEKTEKQNDQVKVWVRFVGLRPLFVGVGPNEKAAVTNAEERAKRLIDSL